MIQITVTDSLPSETIDIVHELKKRGYVQGVDFDFAFNQTKWDGFIGEIPKHTIFTFYKDELATWFELTYK